LVDWKKPFREIPVGKGRVLRKGSDIGILSIGHIGNFVAEAADLLEKEHIGVAHYDMRFVKPLDEELLHKIFKQFKQVITVEDGVISGGFGSAVLEFMCDNGYTSQVKRLGVPDRFIDHGTQAELYKECGYDVEGIVNTVKSLVKVKILSKAV
jgi:1-deoxy-D-xylulose-5-phosphate synthase